MPPLGISDTGRMGCKVEREDGAGPREISPP